MSLLTPIGPLETLKTDQPQTLINLFSFDKHNTLEGILIEGLVDQFLSELQPLGIQQIDCTVVKSSKFKESYSKSKRPVWWLWPRDYNEDSINILSHALAQINNATFFICHYNSQQFDFCFSNSTQVAERAPDLNKCKNIVKVQEFLACIRNINLSELKFTKPSKDVTDQRRLSSAITNGLFNVYKNSFFYNVVLQRIYKNFVIQPFFDSLWDLDTLLLLPDNRIIQLEIKHKYPYGKHQLRFGINKGQVDLIKELSDIGIDTLHIIIVKPIWNMKQDPEYLINDEEKKRKTLILACYIDKNSSQELISSLTKYSRKTHTSFDGESNNAYKEVNVEKFCILGTLNEPKSNIAANIQKLITRQQLPFVNKSILEEHRLNN